MSRTFFIIKPDGMLHFEEIKQMAEAAGLQMVKSAQVDCLTKALLEEHYAHIADKPFFPGIVKYMQSGPVTIGIWEGEQAVEKWRQLLGATNPTEAAEGTIRQRYGCINEDGVMANVAHGSDSDEAAEREIGLFFGREA